MDVVDALVCTRMHLTTPDDLRNRVDALLKACVEAGWSESMIPKFHWMIHYAFHLARFDCLPTCWVHERKHKVIKRYGTDIENLSTYSRSVISEATSHQLESLRRDCALDLGFGFDVKREAPRRLALPLRSALGLQRQPLWKLQHLLAQLHRIVRSMMLLWLWAQMKQLTQPAKSLHCFK